MVPLQAEAVAGKFPVREVSCSHAVARILSEFGTPGNASGRIRVPEAFWRHDNGMAPDFRN